MVAVILGDIAGGDGAASSNPAERIRRRIQLRLTKRIGRCFGDLPRELSGDAGFQRSSGAQLVEERLLQRFSVGNFDDLLSQDTLQRAEIAIDPAVHMLLWDQMADRCFDMKESQESIVLIRWQTTDNVE